MMKLILNYRVVCLLIASFTIGFVYPDNASAADKQDKSARRNAIMMQKMKQDMEQEKAHMQVQFDLQKKELEDKNKLNDEHIQKLEKSLAILEHKAKSLESDLKIANTEKATLDTKLQETQAQLDIKKLDLANLKLQYTQAQVDLKFNDNQRRSLSTNLAATTKSLNTCESKNTKLYQFGAELIQIYDKPSTYNAVMRKEPFFQLKRVELENILQNQKDKLDDEQLISGKSAYQ